MIKRLWNKWIHMYRFPYNIPHIPVNFFKFIKELFSFIHNGYPYEAVYENYNYFINTQREIFKKYLEHHWGYPGYEDAATNEQWEDIVRHMIDLLDKMDENNYDINYEINPNEPLTHEKEMIKAKNEFFELYSKWFFDLWD